MGLQIACLRECLMPHFGQLNGLSTVDFFMGLQITCLRECLATLWTAKWFVTSVDFFMGLVLDPVCGFAAKVHSTHQFSDNRKERRI